MSRRREVERQLAQLRELQEIIGSMKTLSQLELHKLGGLADNRQAMTERLQQVAADFLHFFPQPTVTPEAGLWLVIGSERGFCGDFNETLLRHLQQSAPDCVSQPQRILAVGRKLWSRLEESLPGFIPLDGASVSEEVPKQLADIVSHIHQQLGAQQAGSLTLLYHGDEQGTVTQQQLLPPQPTATTTLPTTPPLLQLPAAQFFREFLQHYLFLQLSGILTTSLRAENHNRVQHLEGAVRRLDDRLTTLASRSRTLRQEEITEEIEMILLGTGMFTPVGSRW